MREADLMRHLPSDIILDNILTRLPFVSIMSCKCVCKSWLDLLTTREFADSYLSKSVPGLLILQRKMRQPKAFKFIEFTDDHEHRMNTVFNFDLPCNEALRSSVNGLLLLRKDADILICNPITREYIKLPCLGTASSLTVKAFGFGVSRMSNQYKVVRVFNKVVNISKLDQCEVYTVGTGSWKRISSYAPFIYPEFGVGTGVFFNGNLHWVVRKRFYCFDLEKEEFSTISPPPHDDDHRVNYRVLSVLGDCLCVCDQHVKSKDGFLRVDRSDIWLMKEYGNGKSWTREFSIRQLMKPSFDYLFPVKVFKDGNYILMALGRKKLLYYSNKTQSINKLVDLPGVNLKHIYCNRVFYAPSFLPLKTFTMENVNSF